MENEYIGIVLAMGVVTYIPRWVPLFLLASRRLPERLLAWLDLIPAAILSALLLPALLMTEEPRQLALLRPELLVALPAFWIAFKTKSLGGTVLTGMGLYWLADKIF